MHFCPCCDTSNVPVRCKYTEGHNEFLCTGTVEKKGKKRQKVGVLEVKAPLTSTFCKISSTKLPRNKSILLYINKALGRRTISQMSSRKHNGKKLMRLPVITRCGAYEQERKRHREKQWKQRGNAVNELTAQALTNPNPPIMLSLPFKCFFLPFEPGETQFVPSPFPGFCWSQKKQTPPHE